MNLQKKLIQLSEYKCSFKYVDSYFLISMTYPQSWSIIPSEDRTIEVAEEDGITFYAAPIETDIDIAFTLIDDTISYNLDVEKKMALLKYNIGKLQELFAEKSLEELETLTFVTTAIECKTTKEKKAKKKTTPKKKTITKKKKEAIEETTEFKEYNNADTLELTYPQEIEDDVMNENYEEEIQVTVEPIQMENKYLEEVER